MTAQSASLIASVQVAGGRLAVETYPGSSEPVLAIHGVSSTRKLWIWLHEIAPDLTLVAPDLRGRGDSISVGGESSLSQHAEDLVAVLDQLGIDSAHVCGMSMGGFVATRLAAAHPERVKSVILVDGGFPMPTPPGLTRDALPAVFAARLERLQQQWPSLDDYLAFFVPSTTPLLDPTDPLLRGYLAHDLRDGRVQLSGDALLADAGDVYFGDNPWRQVAAPIRFLHAEWGSGPGAAPGYPLAAVEEIRHAAVEVRYLAGHDHAATVMSRSGAAAVADLIRQALTSSEAPNER